MARVLVLGHPIITYDSTPRDKYWGALSQHIIAKYSKREFKDRDEVRSVLMEAFQFLTDCFRGLIENESELPFFMFAFLLHEESIKLYRKIEHEKQPAQLDRIEFSKYRRVLKLVLEQGCDIDLQWGKKPTDQDIDVFTERLVGLIYLGTWMYEVSDMISFHDMIGDAKEISFNDEGVLSIQWKYHYGVLYEHLISTLDKEYYDTVYDIEAGTELRNALESCFGLDLDFAINQINIIQHQHNPRQPEIQTIQPHVLPINLIQNYNTTERNAEVFYEGLSLRRSNKLSIEDAICKPYSLQRYLFRPILIYNIAGVERALVGQEKLQEAFHVIATNAVQFNAMFPEWQTNTGMKRYMDRKGHEHDKILEDKIEKIIVELELPYCRNVKTLKLEKGAISLVNPEVGEIDFLIINPQYQTLFVGECKYNRTRYEGTGFKADYSNFKGNSDKHYENKLSRKVNWMQAHLPEVQVHFQKLYPKVPIDLTGYDVEGVFFLNTPTFYMFNGAFYGITINKVKEYLSGDYLPAEIIVPVKREGEDGILISNHPYFQIDNIHWGHLGD